MTVIADDNGDVQQLTMRHWEGANSTTVVIEAGIDDDCEAVRRCGLRFESQMRVAGSHSFSCVPKLSFLMCAEAPTPLLAGSHWYPKRSFSQ